MPSWNVPTSWPIGCSKMLVAFQQALAELVGSPELVAEFRRRPELLAERYDLTPVEQGRLATMVAHKGMKANMVLYRANRLAPIALNLPGLCEALGQQLRPLLWEYWKANPRSDVHFLVEADRFRSFVVERLDMGEIPPGVATATAKVLATEGVVLAARLAISRSPTR